MKPLLDIDSLLKVIKVPLKQRQEFGFYLLDTMCRYEINNYLRVSAFIATVSHESNNFQTLSENLNYSAEALARTWPSRFRDSNGNPNKTAKEIARNPEKIANIAYNGRMGNTELGDGYRFRGRGIIQITGRANYTALEKGTGICCISDPDLLLEPEYASLSAGFYWKSNNIDKYSDKDNFDAVSDLVNMGRVTARYGDSIGWNDRLRKYNALKEWFNENGKEFSLMIALTKDEKQEVNHIREMKIAKLEEETKPVEDNNSLKK